MGLELDARSDLFSLGLVLYECLTGKPAFTGVTPMDICAKVIRDNPVPPSQINAAVSVDLERVTLRALEEGQRERYQSATELAADLQTLELTYSGVVDYRSIRLNYCRNKKPPETIVASR